MVTSAPNITVCTITYLTHLSTGHLFVGIYLAMVMGLYNITYRSQVNGQGMGLVHDTTDIEVCIINR